MSQPSPAIDAIFLAAIEKTSAEERASYLDEACGQDGELRKRVERLLAAHPKAAGSFLESPPDELQQTIGIPPIKEGPGTVIGRYKLLQEIGEGGFGVVYMAEQQEPVRRKVALKIIKPGMDTREVVARFEAERQALALMDHPHIARVLDAGATDSGRPYFVMELVRGIPVTDYCDKNNLSPTDRLGLFVSICQAVQHAHQKGIIHRDVKPSNVLVTLHDGKPVVKVIDFGVAKAIDRRLTERTLFTRFSEMIGTPLYMSPEQAEMSGLDVDTRTDIYSLGVLLYELLTGTTPFDKERLGKAAYDEIRRIIREEEPPKPSTKVSTLGETASTVSGHRQTEPRKLSALLKGDLDWIVMKALEKDRTRRYETAKDFAEDVQHYLSDQPVEARAPSTLYRVHKFVRRNRVTAASVVTLSTTLIATTIFSTYMAARATREADRAIATEKELTAAKVKLESALQDSRNAQDNTLKTMDRLAEEFVSSKRFGDAERICTELRRVYENSLPEDDARRLRADYRLARVLSREMMNQRGDRFQEAFQLFKRTYELQKKTLGLTADDTRATLSEWGGMCRARAFTLCFNPDAPEFDRKQALELARFCLQLDDNLTYGRSTLALALYRNGDYPGALDALGDALSQGKPTFGTFDLAAMTYWMLGKQQLAHDWYLAERERELDTDGKNNLTLWVAEVEGLLKTARSQQANELDGAGFVAIYSRLIAEHPKSVELYRRRRIHYARCQEWEKAAADSLAAAQLPLGDWRDREAWAAYLVGTGDSKQYRSACIELLNRTKDFPLWTVRDAAVVCCLAPDTGIDFAKLDRSVAGSDRSVNSVQFIRFVKGLIAHRLGQYDQAVEYLREANGDPKVPILGKLFTAMAQHKLGNTGLARESLHEARRRIATLCPSPLGPPCPFQHRTVVWCMTQTALHEAEAMIEPTAKNQGAVTSTSP